MFIDPFDNHLWLQETRSPEVRKHIHFIAKHGMMWDSIGKEIDTRRRYLFPQRLNWQNVARGTTILKYVLLKSTSNDAVSVCTACKGPSIFLDFLIATADVRRAREDTTATALPRPERWPEDSATSVAGVPSTRADKTFFISVSARSDHTKYELTGDVKTRDIWPECDRVS